LDTGWPDRYRPTTLEEMALAPDLRQRFEYLLAHGLSRHLILSGPAGFGKTTIARLLAQKLYRDHDRAVLVTSGENGVDYIREQVTGFMRGLMFGDEGKLLIFEEAQKLTDDAQVALRQPLELWADLCKVIFLTNELDKLEKPLRDRCEEIVMERPPNDECGRVLGLVLAKEGISSDPETVQAFVWGYFTGNPDAGLRKLLGDAQGLIETTGQLPVPPPPPLGSMLEMWQSTYRPEDATDGAKLLNDLTTQFSTYLVLPPGGVEALALWTVFAWAHEAFGISPILTLASPTMRAGKTTAFEMLEQLLIPGATYHPSSMTPAVAFRLKGLASEGGLLSPSEFQLPTLCLLMDEADNWMNMRPELRGVLNSGWKRRGAVVPRVAPGGKVEQFSSWYPKALALIDRSDAPLPGTLRDRSIVVPMQRKGKDEVRQPFPHHQPVPALAALCEQLFYWTRAHFTTLRDLGTGDLLAASTLNDRAKNNWQPLMAIAHVAGGEWEDRARWASKQLAETSREEELLIDLLGDIKTVFNTDEALQSTVLVQKLVALEGSPWKERRLTAIRLSRMLRPLHIQPKGLWIDTGLGAKKTNKQGYRREWFDDAFKRYL
jgi:uncharacterized protein DUF3631/ATPase family protein associated with various cellular activities (AAA)